MAGAFEKGNLLSILAAGRKPQWVEQTGHEGAPDSTGDGVYLENSLQTYVVVEVRENVAYRTAVFTGDGLELAIEIDLTFDGNALVVSGPFDDTAAALAAIKAGIEADSTLNDLLTATLSADETTLTIIGKAEEDYSIDQVNAVGGGTLTCTADALTGAARVFVIMRESNGPTNKWVMAYDADYTLGRRGFVDRFASGGQDRVYVEIYDLAGHADDGPEVVQAITAVWIGPCVVE